VRADERLPAPGPVSEELDGELVVHGRIMPASNATFIGEIDGVRVVYKPVAGERPLWDFPDHTLARREVAAYAVSEALGWDIVPRTWLREGPHGEGMVQLWREPDEGVDAVRIVPVDAVPDGWCHVFDGVDGHDQPVSLVHEDTAALRRMAVFDVLVNNADRKGGHVLPMADGHRYGVDHGVTFHTEPKLRTILWGWLGEPVGEEDLAVVDGLLEHLEGQLGVTLRALLAEREVTSFEHRCARLLDKRVMPAPTGAGPAIPWPPF
jgi:uncharacterized repeat protein (TIGR03843 family)